jgi:LPS export ABC transporter protein LptC
MFQHWRILSGILIFTLVGGAGAFVYFSPSSPSSSHPTKQIQESMSGVRATRFDKEGRLYQTISMSKWEHFKNETVTAMQAPTLTLYYPNGKVCEISAKFGEGFQADLKGPLEKLHLSQNVLIQQTDNNPQGWWELKTSSLVYFPASQTAMTDEQVFVASPALQLESQGMKVYLEQQRVEFIQQIKSHYAKNT